MSSYQTLKAHQFLLKQERHASQPPAVALRMAGVRQLTLITINIFVTLGMLTSLLYLSWSGHMKGARPTEVIRSHLPALEHISVSFHLPLILGGLVVVFIFFVLYASVGHRFTRTTKQAPLHCTCEQGVHPFDLLTVASGAMTLRLSTTRKISLALHIDPEHEQIVFWTPKVPVTLHDARSSAQEERKDQETTPTTSDEIAALLCQIYATVLALPAEQVDLQTDFFDSGGDSLAVIALLAALNRFLDIDLDPNEVFDHPVLSDLTIAIRQQASTTQRAEQKEEERSVA